MLFNITHFLCCYITYTLLVPTCWTVFVCVISYCCDMFQSQFLSIIREVATLSAYTAHVKTCVEEMDCVHQCQNMIKPKTLKSLKSVYCYMQFKLF